MAAPHRLNKIAEERGESLHILIPRTIEKEGSVKGAARQLGVAEYSVARWLENNGYHVETRQVATVTRDEPEAVEHV